MRGREETGCIAEHDNNSTLCIQEKKCIKNVKRCRVACQMFANKVGMI